VPLFKLCPSKFDALKKEKNTETTNLKSYNSNSSISSSNSDTSNSTTTDETTSNNLIILEDDDDDDNDDVEENEDIIVFKDNKDIKLEIVSSKKQQQQATSPTLLKEDQNEFLLLNKFPKEKIFKDDASSTQSDESIGTNNNNNNKQDENLIILEICADCYQMMEGVTVNTTTTTTTPTENIKQQIKEHNKIQAYSSTSSSSSTSTLEKPQNNLVKSIYMNKNAKPPSDTINNSNSNNGEMSASCSSDAIVMNSLSNVNIVTNCNEILITNTSKDSPMLSKKSFGKLQSHSTPSTSTSNLGAILANKQHENELSQIALSVDEASIVAAAAERDLFAKNIRVTREKLTLDLHPVYTTTAKSSSSS
jgi:hypothetical protein